MWPFSPGKSRAKVKAAVVPWTAGEPHAAGNPWGSLATDVTAISARSAENLAAVLAAVNAISCTISSLPAYVVRADDSRADQPDHPLQRLIDYGVGEDESWSDFIEGFLASALLRGNGLAEIITDQSGRLMGLRTIPWSSISPWVDDAGVLLFDEVRTLPPNAGKRRRLMRADVLHLKDRADNALIGVSRLQRAAGALGIALELQAASSLFFGNAARPAGALQTEQRINDDLAARMAQDFQAAYSGRERGKLPVLQGGLKFERYGLLTSEDAQIVEHRNFSVADVSRIFQVPPFMLADPSRSTFASAREGSRHFAMMCLAPWVAKLQRAFAQSVLSSQYRLVIDLGDLLRADPEARWASWQRARQAGVLSPNEVRLEEGWPASSDPTAHLISPPVLGGAQPMGAEGGDVKPPPTPSAEDDDQKVARLPARR